MANTPDFGYKFEKDKKRKWFKIIRIIFTLAAILWALCSIPILSKGAPINKIITFIWLPSSVVLFYFWIIRRKG
ncbi:MAG: hypothetical protein AAF502_19075 [Bacteroidota bacterium]